MKNSRHEKILELIAKYDVETQEDLAQLLAEHGHKVTQATVCRDIKELRLAKAANEHGVYKYVQAGAKQEGAAKQQDSILLQSVNAVDFAQNIVIIKTYAGMAQAAAAVLDAMHFEEIMGSVAGDDTLLCITKTEEKARSVTQRIRSML